MKIYLPSTSSPCVVIQNASTIRSYDTQPTHGANVNYTDYYINSHYIYTKGTQQFTQYSTLPTCLTSTTITDNVFYRADIDSILVTFFIILIICFYFPYRLISRCFGRWLKW